MEFRAMTDADETENFVRLIREMDSVYLKHANADAKEIKGARK